MITLPKISPDNKHNDSSVLSLEPEWSWVNEQRQSEHIHTYVVKLSPLSISCLWAQGLPHR